MNQDLFSIGESNSFFPHWLPIVVIPVVPMSNLGQRWGLPAAGVAASEPKGKRKRGDSVSSIKPSKQRKKRRTGKATAVSVALAAPAAPAASAASGAACSASAAAGLATETAAQHLQRHCSKDAHLRCARCKWLGLVTVSCMLLGFLVLVQLFMKQHHNNNKQAQ